MKPYSELLKDPRWQKKRLERLEASDWMCESCGAKDKTLHVHHPLYKTGHKPWEYETDELQTLCSDCHADVTAAGKLLTKHLASNAPCSSALTGIAFGYLYANDEIEGDDLGVLLVSTQKIHRLIGAVACSMLMIPRSDFARIAADVLSVRRSYCPNGIGISSAEVEIEKSVEFMATHSFAEWEVML